jgi:hypothetical protein
VASHCGELATVLVSNSYIWCLNLVGVYYSGAKYGRKENEENFNQIATEYDDGITIDQVMASGALPELYDAKGIGGRKFWDGGVLSNTPFKELAIMSPMCGRTTINRQNRLWYKS